jgi:catechol 2,3-dioxygenase-like lactoylglutathione lyase family enzyme
VIDHITLGVRDLAASRRFYEAVLEPLGHTEVHESEHSFEIGDFSCADDRVVARHVHVAFKAQNRQQVQAFYTAALAAGGRDNGAPGERPRYHPGYYAAYVIDPDGHNVEAVFHERSAGGSDVRN